MAQDRKKTPNKPVLHSTKTGGLRINSSDLFTTEVGRNAVRQMIGIRFTRRNAKATSNPSIKRKA